VFDPSPYVVLTLFHHQAWELIINHQVWESSDQNSLFLGGTHTDADFSKPQLFEVVYFGVQAHEDMYHQTF
jgi:hypothetical protein